MDDRQMQGGKLGLKSSNVAATASRHPGAKAMAAVVAEPTTMAPSNRCPAQLFVLPSG